MKVVALHSGGMDSTTLLYWLISQGHEVVALSFNYMQRHKKELNFAMETVSLLGINRVVIDLGMMLKYCAPHSSLTNPRVDVPHGHYEDESMKVTVVPGRNLVMLSIAAAYASGNGHEAVALAAHAGDHAIYPDCRPAFLEAVQRTYIEGFDPSLEFITPWAYNSKADIAKEGSFLGVPYELTWSCYEGKELHCGKCGTCVERIEAFKLAGVEDPTEYANG